MSIINVLGLKNIKTVSFYLGGCEYVTVSLDNIKKLEVGLNGYYVDAHIVDNGNIQTRKNHLDDYTPCQKLQRHNLVGIALEYEDGHYENYPIRWSNNEFNKYQKNTFYSYNEIKISVKIDNTKIDFDDVLNFDTGTVLECKSNNRLVEIIEINNDKYLAYLDSKEIVPFSSLVLKEEFILSNLNK